MRGVRILLILGILIVIFFTNYQVITKFTGQHTFISGREVNCTECHPNEGGNLSISVYHSSLNCSTCHNTTFYPNEQTHAASTINCTDCHTWVKNEITHEDEAHRALYLYAEQSELRRGPNEACIMCHTNAYTKITYKYYDYINYTLSSWSVTSVAYGPYRTYIVEVGSKSGSSHYWINITNISCVRCHENIKLGNIGNAQGSQHAGDVTDWSSDPGHQNASYGGATDAYCKSCHRNTSFNGYPHLNSSAVHAALKLQFGCLTCHNETGPWPPANETFEQGGHPSSTFYQNIAQNVDRKLIGDFCTGCHHANNHDITGSSRCSRCHRWGSISQQVFTEPKAAEASRWVIR